MARGLGYKLTPAMYRRVLVLSEDPWLRFRLQREFERAGCEVVTLAQLRPGDSSHSLPYDAILTDAALFPQGSRLEALRALRASSPDAHFVLLVGAADQVVREQAQHSGFDLVLQRPPRVDGLPGLVERTLDLMRPHVDVGPVGIPVHFDLLVASGRGVDKRSAGTALTSFAIHAVLLSVALLFPLFFTESLDPRQFASTWLVAPPPPPPPPPPAPSTALQARKIKPLMQTINRLVAPVTIPREIARIVDTEESLDAGGVVGGVPGGVPGGQLGGVIGGVLGGLPSVVPRPMAMPTPAKPLRVGGNIRPPRLITRVEPPYPPLARQARVQGDVRIDAIIDVNGRVVEMQVLSGHPLLVAAALQAVQQWLYEPTYLNEQPAPVVLEVTVHFIMQ